MRRREFISLVGVMAAAWPLVTCGHQPGMTRSGVLMSAAQTNLEKLMATEKVLSQVAKQLGRVA